MVNPFRPFIIQFLIYFIVNIPETNSSPITAERSIPFDLMQQAKKSRKIGTNKG
jgi:hypothetical protein